MPGGEVYLVFSICYFEPPQFSPQRIENTQHGGRFVYGHFNLYISRTGIWKKAKRIVEVVWFIGIYGYAITENGVYRAIENLTVVSKTLQATTNICDLDVGKGAK